MGLTVVHTCKTAVTIKIGDVSIVSSVPSCPFTTHPTQTTADLLSVILDFYSFFKLIFFFNFMKVIQAPG